MKKPISVLLAIIFVLGMTGSAFAAESGLSENVIAQPVPPSKSYNSSFTLDFSQSTAWTLDFTNNAFMMFNHNKVSVEYKSNTPSNSTANVRVELYIDDDGDGVYESCDPNGGYRYTIKKGETLKIALPHGNTVKDYRLVFTNLNSAVTGATFAVKTIEN